MSADENFLARWSRRKRGVVAPGRDHPAPKMTEDRAPSTIAGASDPAQDTGPLVDLASLPPIESLAAGSDIRAFLAPGVPVDLARAALRRAWSADPAVRDFIGLSENSWDFSAPRGVPGFGTVTKEEAQRLMARLAGEPIAAEVGRPAPEPLSDGLAAALDGAKEEPEAIIDNVAVQAHAGKNYIAPQHEFGTTECRPLLQRRRHGSALPE